ncbi:MAG: VOC family protein [Nocardioidaceae bacterium]|jgi:predicted enzyme related to lactoylglutathione lyase
MTTTKIGSILLASTDHRRLRDWYAEAFEPDETGEVGDYRVLGFGGFYVMFDARGDIAEANPDPARVIVNVEVDDAHAVAARLDNLGARWVAELEDRDGSFFATAIDPDGNYVQVVQLSEEARRQMASQQFDPA